MSNDNPYYVFLYYGIENDYANGEVYCAFEATDPAIPTKLDTMSKELAMRLDLQPDDYRYELRVIPVRLPQSLVDTIIADAHTNQNDQSERVVEKTSQYDVAIEVTGMAYLTVEASSWEDARDKAEALVENYNPADLEWKQYETLYVENEDGKRYE